MSSRNDDAFDAVESCWINDRRTVCFFGVCARTVGSAFPVEFLSASFPTDFGDVGPAFARRLTGVETIAGRRNTFGMATIDLEGACKTD